jgi:thioredoxin 2
MSTTESAAPSTATLRCQFCLSWNRVDLSRAADRPKCGKCARPMLLDRPLRLDDETFERTVAGAAVPVLVDFYADWCGPCKAMAPAVDALAAKVQGRALVAKVDTDHSPATAQRFDIRAIPTVIVFEGGRETRRQPGAVPLPALEALLGGAGTGH